LEIYQSAIERVFEVKVLIGKDIKTKKHIYHICLQFQPKDAWIGIYIEHAFLGIFIAYICILPFFPIHIKQLPNE